MKALFSTSTSRSRSGCLRLASLVLCLAFGLSTQAFAESGPSDLASFEGHWRRVDSRVDDVARYRAIDSAIDDLAWITRKMAGGVLKKSTAQPLEIRFRWDGERLVHEQFRESGDPLARSVHLDGLRRDLKDPQGKPFSGLWEMTPSGLQWTWAQHQATGSNVYRLDPSSDELIVEHTIQITAIDDVAPIVFESRFGRRDLPSVAASSSSRD